MYNGLQENPGTRPGQQPFAPPYPFVTGQRLNVNKQRRAIDLQKSAVNKQRRAISVKKSAVNKQRRVISVKKSAVNKQRRVIDLQKSAVNKESGNFCLQNIIVYLQRTIKHVWRAGVYVLFIILTVCFRFFNSAAIDWPVPWLIHLPQQYAIVVAGAIRRDKADNLHEFF